MVNRCATQKQKAKNGEPLRHPKSRKLRMVNRCATQKQKAKNGEPLRHPKAES